MQQLDPELSSMKTQNRLPLPAHRLTILHPHGYGRYKPVHRHLHHSSLQLPVPFRDLFHEGVRHRDVSEP